MRALSSIPFCPYNGRRVSLRYLSAAVRYMTEVHDPTVAPFAVAPGEGTGVQWRCAVIVGSWGAEGLPTLRHTSQKGALQPTKDPWSSVGEKP
jgi:hypothetical protein